MLQESLLGPEALGNSLAQAAARTSDLVLVLSREGVVRFANPAARTALANEGLPGQSLVELVEILSRDPLQAALEKAVAGTVAHVVLRFLEPPTELDATLTSAADGARDLVMFARRRPLERELAVRLEELNRRYVDKVRELASLTGRLREAAVTDQLTNLFNRRAFLDRAEAEWVRSHRHVQPLSVVVLDIDVFKTVNDRFGHATGDMVLKHFGVLLRITVRGSDIPARIGGEEFVALLPHTDVRGAALLAERLRFRLAEHAFDLGDKGVLQVTCSAGVAGSEGARGFAEMLGDADAALYRAKADGRDCVCVAEPRVSSDAA